MDKLNNRGCHQHLNTTDLLDVLEPIEVPFAHEKAIGYDHDRKAVNLQDDCCIFNIEGTMDKYTMPLFSEDKLEAICAILGETDQGLTGDQIARLLEAVRVEDVDKKNTKRVRLFNALAIRQNADQNGDRVFAFISRALAPARYQGRVVLFQERRRQINVILAFLGFEFGEDGKFYRVSPADSLIDAEARASRLRALLTQRQVHPDVLAFCQAELLADNYFHGVLEACKSIAAKLRDKTALKGDGAPLIEKALCGTNPPMRINTYSSDSETGEQRGFANLLIGLFGMFRNPTSHEARIRWPMSEEDALDLFCLASLAHRRIDAASVGP